MGSKVFLPFKQNCPNKGWSPTLVISEHISNCFCPHIVCKVTLPVVNVFYIIINNDTSVACGLSHFELNNVTDLTNIAIILV